jgi:pilus assembly protein CpaB
MARGRGPILIVSSLLLAAGAAWLANQWIMARAVATPSRASTRTLTAAVSLPLGTRIDSRHVSSIEMIAGQEPAGTFHDEKEIDGKVTSVNIQAGQLLMASMFAKEGESALAANVLKDKRAVTVRVDDVVGVAGFLLPGNRVDVVATSKDDRSMIISSETILSNIKVLAVDQTTATNSNEPVVVRAVTLEVSPQEAEILLKGKAAGSIQLALRNPEDQGDSRTKHEPSRLVVKPAVRPPARNPRITVIRGTKVAQEAANEQK